MTQQQIPVLRPETLVEEFEKNGVTHIITIPDSETNYLLRAHAEAALDGHHPGFTWKGRAGRRPWDSMWPAKPQWF